MHRILNISLILMTLLTLTSCQATPVGNYITYYKASLWIDETKEIPFTLVAKVKEGVRHWQVRNGKEIIEIDEAITRNDSLYITMPIFRSRIIAVFKDDRIVGTYYKYEHKDDYAIPFLAVRDVRNKFESTIDAAVDVSGRWEVAFSPSTDDEYPAIGEFKQTGNQLTGTFMTETGDYRFLSGNVSGNTLSLSCFDGSHAFLFTAQMGEDNRLVGNFWSGKHWEEPWEAIKNPDVSLTDPNQLTQLLEGEAFTFAFSDLEGTTVSLEDERYKDKVVVVQVLGTWCPNCLDETAFYSRFYNESDAKDLAIVGVAFERSEELASAKPILEKYQQRLDIKYDLLFGGKASKKVASEAFPMLNKIMSFPTTIILDKNHQVRKIHTGFNGPATSVYADFESEFSSLIYQLLKE